LRAVVSSSGARGRTYAERFGARYCTSDYDQVLRDDDVDIVLVASRNRHHASQALSALKSGKHVFLEKPMALTENECRELCTAVAQSGRCLTVGFNRRFSPYYIAMKKRLDRRTGPAVLNLRVNSPGISGSYWMADPAAGGAILGEACHFVDLMYWLLDSEPVSVSAYCLPTGQQEPIGENNLAVCFRFADGSIANLTYSTLGSMASLGERVEAYAQGLAVCVEDFKRLIVGERVRREHSRFWAEKGYRAELESFMASVREGSPLKVTVKDGVRATVGCLRMLESARDGDPRSIDLREILGE